MNDDLLAYRLRKKSVQAFKLAINQSINQSINHSPFMRRKKQ